MSSTRSTVITTQAKALDDNLRRLEVFVGGGTKITFGRGSEIRKLVELLRQEVMNLSAAMAPTSSEAPTAEMREPLLPTHVKEGSKEMRLRAVVLPAAKEAVGLLKKLKRQPSLKLANEAQLKLEELLVHLAASVRSSTSTSMGRMFEGNHLTAHLKKVALQLRYTDASRNWAKPTQPPASATVPEPLPAPAPEADDQGPPASPLPGPSGRQQAQDASRKRAKPSQPSAPAPVPAPAPAPDASEAAPEADGQEPAASPRPGPSGLQQAQEAEPQRAALKRPASPDLETAKRARLERRLQRSKFVEKEEELQDASPSAQELSYLALQDQRKLEEDFGPFMRSVEAILRGAQDVERILEETFPPLRVSLADREQPASEESRKEEGETVQDREDQVRTPDKLYHPKFAGRQPRRGPCGPGPPPHAPGPYSSARPGGHLPRRGRLDNIVDHEEIVGELEEPSRSPGQEEHLEELEAEEELVSSPLPNSDWTEAPQPIQEAEPEDLSPQNEGGSPIPLTQTEEETREDSPLGYSPMRGSDSGEDDKESQNPELGGRGCSGPVIHNEPINPAAEETRELWEVLHDAAITLDPEEDQAHCQNVVKQPEIQDPVPRSVWRPMEAAQTPASPVPPRINSPGPSVTQESKQLPGHQVPVEHLHLGQGILQAPGVAEPPRTPATAPLREVGTPRPPGPSAPVERPLPSQSVPVQELHSRPVFRQPAVPKQRKPAAKASGTKGKGGGKSAAPPALQVPAALRFGNPKELYLPTHYLSEAQNMSLFGRVPLSCYAAPPPLFPSAQQERTCRGAMAFVQALFGQPTSQGGPLPGAAPQQAPPAGYWNQGQNIYPPPTPSAAPIQQGAPYQQPGSSWDQPRREEAPRQADNIAGPSYLPHLKQPQGQAHAQPGQAPQQVHSFWPVAAPGPLPPPSPMNQNAAALYPTGPSIPHPQPVQAAPAGPLQPAATVSWPPLTLPNQAEPMRVPPTSFQAPDQQDVPTCPPATPGPPSPLPGPSQQADQPPTPPLPDDLEAIPMSDLFRGFFNR